MKDAQYDESSGLRASEKSEVYMRRETNRLICKKLLKIKLIEKKGNVRKFLGHGWDLGPEQSLWERQRTADME